LIREGGERKRTARKIKKGSTSFYSVFRKQPFTKFLRRKRRNAVEQVEGGGKGLDFKGGRRNAKLHLLRRSAIRRLREEGVQETKTKEKNLSLGERGAISGSAEKKKVLQFIRERRGGRIREGLCKRFYLREFPKNADKERYTLY